MTELRPATHTEAAEALVEVWEDGHKIAAIYPTERGIRIVSKYLGTEPEAIEVETSYTPALNIRIWDGKPRSSALDHIIETAFGPEEPN
jgi:hypothetical protein